MSTATHNTYNGKRPAATDRLLIESDGTSYGTMVTVDGKPVDGCCGVDWAIRSGDVAEATLRVDLIQMLVASRHWTVARQTWRDKLRAIRWVLAYKG